MSQSKVWRGADIKLYIAGNLYPEVQSVSYTIDYGEDAIYGIDSIFCQEIATTRVSVQGSISGIMLKLSGGLQGKDVTTRIIEKLFAPYVSFELRDRLTDSKIVFIPHIKVVQETFQVQGKGTVKLSFNFKGIIPLSPIDMS